jgi:hypothetical protein
MLPPMRFGNGAAARIVCRELIAVEAQMAEKFTAGPKFDASVNAAGIVSVKATANGSTSSGTVLTLGPGTCLGYALLNFSWNDSKSQIGDPRLDEQGID